MKTGILILTVCCLSGYAQQTANVEGAFHFTTPQTAQSLQEAATIARSVFDLPQAATDPAQSSLTFAGPAANVAMAEWTLSVLDAPGAETGEHQYTAPTGEVVRVSFTPNLPNTQAMQELLTILRTVADIQKIYNFSARKAW